VTSNRWNDPFRKSDDPKAVVSRHRGRLLAMSQVVSVGLGFGSGHRTVIVVGVSSLDDAGNVSLPDHLDGVPLEVRVVGTLTAKDEGEER
jgi:hypothetical protein